jgi:hypothetical protein
VIVDVLKVGPGRHENEVAGIGNIDRLLNRWLIGWNADCRCRNRADKQTGQRNNESNFQIEQFGMMHSGTFLMRAGARFLET